MASRCLAGNPLGDPDERELTVYLPHGYDETSRHYPVLYSLAAYTSSGPAQVAWRNHGENLPARLDRLIESGEMAPAICVMPDSYTSLGGNQFVDSPALGDYASWLVEEVVPAVDAGFRTIPEADARAAFGKSSGGFGAIHIAATRPGTFGAIASHAGDCGFDRVYLRDFPLCCDELARDDGDLEAFVRRFWNARRPGGRMFHALMTLCLAASYSPDPEAPLGLRLPFDLRTCKLDSATWARWLAFDPLGYEADRLEALAGLRGFWLDAGSRDQYFIHYGTREFHDRLERSGVAHHHEEFDGNHSGMDWRFDASLPWLVARLKQD
ncbi:MAG: alpha/beta hydrolase-fold protein [Wenzhouxiangellaceae bacterium]|nr:alpha/beta hydrolase-fold protein [Wenzhouxiangellaceae bacterium]